MKRTLASIMALAMALLILSSLSLTASAADSYQVEFNFLETSTYESFVVYNYGMKAAGNSTTMGYKGWIGSAGDKGIGATSVFEFSAPAGHVFQSLVINYRGYSIANGAPDGVHIYVSTYGEADYSVGYNESNWTLVAEIVNDSTAGNGINVSDPANRDPEILRTVDVSPYAMGAEKLYMRIDFFRSPNIDGTPATFFAPASVTGDLLLVDPSATEPVVTEPETTAAPETQAPETEPETTKAPETEAPATEAPATEAPATEAPATEAPATEAPATEAPAPETEPAKEGGCGGMIAGGVAIVAILGTALIVKKRD